MDTTDVGSRAGPVAALLFAAIAGLIGVDIAADYRSGTEASHLLTEAAVMALALAGAATLWRQLRSARQQAERLSVDLAAAQHEAERFRNEARDALRGLGDAIDRQFTRWQLTPAHVEGSLLSESPALEAHSPQSAMASAGPAATERLQEVERSHILSVLRTTGGAVGGATGAAAILGLHPNTLRSRMKKLGISTRLR